MNQTNENAQQQKPKFSKMAIASPLVSIIGFLVAIGVLVLFLFLVDVFPSSKLYLPPCLILFVFLVPPLVGLIFGIIADRKIRQSKGLLKGRAFSILGIVLGFIPILSVVLFGIFMPALCRVPRAEQKVLCGANLARLGKAIQAYSERYEKYPTKDIWCDLLIEYADANEENFVCPGALKSGGRCHYALNPNCFPNSPNDVVLIFETKGGWNKYGGPELMTAEHHRYEGCNVLFNSGRVNFIATYQGILQPDKLKWDNE